MPASQPAIASAMTFSLSSEDPSDECRRNVPVMSKTEIILIILVVIILTFAIWFVFSNQIWVLVSYLETLLYPEIVTPE